MTLKPHLKCTVSCHVREILFYLLSRSELNMTDSLGHCTYRANVKKAIDRTRPLWQTRPVVKNFLIERLTVKFGKNHSFLKFYMKKNTERLRLSAPCQN